MRKRYFDTHSRGFEIIQHHWQPMVIKMPTLSSHVSQEVVVMTSSGAVSDEKVGMMTNLGFPLCWHGTSGPRLNIKTVFPMYGISTLNIRRSWDRLMYNMGIPILARQHLYIETVSRSIVDKPLVLNESFRPKGKNKNLKTSSLCVV